MQTDPVSATSSVSRRRLLASAGGVGVAAAAAGIAGVASAQTGEDAAAGAADANDSVGVAAVAAEHDGPVVVHVADLASGTLDVFTGTKHIQIRDKDLATRLSRAAQ
jgi:hypothetical protein